MIDAMLWSERHCHDHDDHQMLLKVDYTPDCQGARGWDLATFENEAYRPLLSALLVKRPDIDRVCFFPDNSYSDKSTNEIWTRHEWLAKYPPPEIGFDQLILDFESEAVGDQ